MARRNLWQVYREAFLAGQVWAYYLPIGLVFLAGMLLIGFKNGWR